MRLSSLVPSKGDQQGIDKLNDIENHLAGHDEQLKIVFGAIRQLIPEEEKPRQKIGF